jgi:hypothetical protein
MKNAEQLLRSLEGYLQEEIGAHARTLSLLRAQEAAILASDPAAVSAGGNALESETRSVVQRARRRDQLLAELGRHWGVAPGTLTLTSICTRLGPDSARLERQCRELRGIVQQVTRSARRLTTVARRHQRMLGDVIERLVGAGGRAELMGSGALVDAEA